jgi:hypothetical protein
MAAEVRNLPPLELVHSGLCEMNSVLTKGGKKPSRPSSLKILLYLLVEI